MDALTSAGFNWVDLIFVFVLVYFALTNNGLVRTLVEIAGFAFALFLSYRFYDFFAGVYISTFSVPRGFASVLGFFSVWFFAEFFFFLFSFGFLNKFLKKWLRHPVDSVFGYLAGAAQAFLIFLFFISLVFALPVRPQIKQSVLDSKTGPFFVSLSQRFEASVKEVFGEAANETLNFLTIRPQSNQTVDLNFRATENLTVDTQSEAIMLDLVNRERASRGLGALSVDVGLQGVARDYAREMFVHGFFSHSSAVDGSDAGQRVSRAGISYTLLGENLAYAPDVYVAHQGLMNSPGHRANILTADFGRAGLGVIDGGVYGKMFVQLFAD